MAEEPPIYLVSGHGDEIIDFERRPILPEGYKVVTFCNCNEFVDLEKMYSIFRLFNQDDPQTQEILMNPEVLQNIPQFRNYNIRIYNPGQRIPNIMTSLITSWTEDKDSDKTAYICKSGIFKYPISSDKLYNKSDDFVSTLKNGSIPAFGFCSDKDTSIEKAQEGSLLEEIPKVIRSAYMSTSRKASFSSSMIMQGLGPGIYYFPICRKGQCEKSDDPKFVEDVSRVRRLSNEQLRTGFHSELIPSYFPITTLARLRMNTKLRNPKISDEERDILKKRLEQDRLAREVMSQTGRGKTRSKRKQTRRKQSKRNKRRKHSKHGKHKRKPKNKHTKKYRKRYSRRRRS